MTGALVLFALLTLILPLIPAFREWGRPSDSAPLTIRTGYLQDRHLAARRFGEEVRICLSDAISGSIPDGDQAVRESDPYEYFQPENALDALSYSDRPAIILAHAVLKVPAHTDTERALFVSGALHSGSGSRYRALYADGPIALGSGSHVSDWIHADGLLTADVGCAFAGSVSSGEAVVLAAGCRFERLHAPDIRFGDDWHWAGPWSPTAGNERIRPRLQLLHRSAGLGSGRIIRGDLLIPAGHRVEGDLVVCGDVRLGEDAVIEGSLKAHGSVSAGPRARIQGSVFAEGAVRIAYDGRIGGVLSAESNVYLQWGVVVGTTDGPTTVTGMQILVDQGVRVHGLVLATESGRVATRTTVRQAA